MGLFYSRPSEQVESMDLSFATYRFPPKSGNYFSSHFVMGDQTFAGSIPECFLFGDNNDLNFLSPRPVAFPYPEAHKSEPSKMLRSLVNLRKDSLRLVKNTEREQNKNEADTYHVDFVFDADVKCTVTIHYLALEDLSSGRAVYSTSKRSLTSRAFEFEKGANQSFFNHGKLHLITPSNFKEMELIYSETTNHIPVVIHIEASEEEYSGHSNITMANIEKLADETYVIKLLKQKQMVDGLCYLLHEIYGLESKEEAENGEDKRMDMSDDDYDDYADENVVCVVCMSDTRDTLMLPCKHLCVCSVCASSLRSGSNNCPICRVPFHALLQLCAYQRASSSHKSQEPFHGYEKVDLFDALNAFNIIKRSETTREIVRRVSARARSRSRPTTPKPQISGSEKLRRSSSRFSRGSHGSYRRDHGDSEPVESVSKTSVRSNTRKGSGKSHVVELDESGSCVVEVKSEASADRVSNVEDGIEVGQDNLGMDPLEEEIGHRTREKTPREETRRGEETQSSTEVHEVDETSREDVRLPPTPSPVTQPHSPVPEQPTLNPVSELCVRNPAPDPPVLDLVLSPYNVPLPGTPLHRDLTGAEIEQRYDS